VRGGSYVKSLANYGSFPRPGPSLHGRGSQGGHRVVAAAEIQSISLRSLESSGRVRTVSLDVRMSAGQGAVAPRSNFRCLDVLRNMRLWQRKLRRRYVRSRTSAHRLKRIIRRDYYDEGVLPTSESAHRGTSSRYHRSAACWPTGRAAYTAAKFGVEGFSESLSKEVGPLGIKVTIVEPGGFERTSRALPRSFAKAGRSMTRRSAATIRFQRGLRRQATGTR